VVQNGLQAVGKVQRELIMQASLQIVVAILLLISVFVFTRYIVIWRIRRAAGFIVNDLDRKGAHDPSNAVALPYASKGFFHIGLRDYRPKALLSLIQAGIVERTEAGRYYLKRRPPGLS
jgi:hypothetical protein